jgi:hypothetical protein
MDTALRASGRKNLPDASTIVDTSVLAAAWSAGSTGTVMQARTKGA